MRKKYGLPAKALELLPFNIILAIVIEIYPLGENATQIRQNPRMGPFQTDDDQIEAANTITQLSAVQNEYSMMERSCEKDAIPACGKLDIVFMPFFPLAGGFLRF